MSGKQQGHRQQAGSTVSSIKLKGHHEVLSDERVIVVASKAVNIPHHMCRAIEDLKEIDESDG